jgi:hypothetical protein
MGLPPTKGMLYIPWSVRDVVNYGWRIRSRINTRTRRYGLFTNHYHWVAEPAFSIYITGYGALAAKMNDYSAGTSKELVSLYWQLRPHLERILNKYGCSKDHSRFSFYEKMRDIPSLSGSFGYNVSTELFNNIIGRSNREIMALSVRLAEENLSWNERRNISQKIAESSRMICIYDFEVDSLIKPF